MRAANRREICRAAIAEDKHTLEFKQLYLFTFVQQYTAYSKEQFNSIYSHRCDRQVAESAILSVLTALRQPVIESESGD